MTDCYRGDAQLRRLLQRWLSADERCGNRVDAIRLAAGVVRVAEETLDQRVLEARSFHHSWSVIADAIGITRQSAHRRWRHFDEDASALAEDRERHFRAIRGSPITPKPRGAMDDWDAWRPESS